MRSTTWDADQDMMRHNPMHAAEREEYRSAVRSMTEAERAVNCGHSRRPRGVCPDCGDDVRGEV